MALVPNYQTYQSFAGADIIATITPRGGKPVQIGTLQTVSYSIHRETRPHYALGRTNPKGWARGPRTIAGTLIWTVFDRHIIKLLAPAITPTDESLQTGNLHSAVEEMTRFGLSDEMPPFDITISFQNELGQEALMAIYGIILVDEGQVMSIEDMITEQTMTYQALDIELMRPVNEGMNRLPAAPPPEPIVRRSIRNGKIAPQ